MSSTKLLSWKFSSYINISNNIFKSLRALFGMLILAWQNFLLHLAPFLHIFCTLSVQDAADLGKTNMSDINF